MSFDSVPSYDELREILNHISPANYDTWYKTFIACGRAYPNDSSVFAICQNWASSYGKRKAVDLNQERYAFYNSSKQRDGVNIGWLITEAKGGGYKPTYNKENNYKSPYQVDLDPLKASLITKVVTSAKEQASNDFDPLLVASNKVVSGLNHVLDFWAFKSHIYFNDRVEFVRSYSDVISFIPFPARTYFQALSDYLSLISPDDYDDRKFVTWGEKNVKNFSSKELYDLCNVDANSDEFTGLTSPAEAAFHFETAITRSFQLVMYQKAKDVAHAALTNSLRNDARSARDDTKKAIAELTSLNVSLDPKIIKLESPQIASTAKESITKQVDPSQVNSVFVSTGYPLIDQKIRGYHRGGTTILAAHSGVGKTWFGVDAVRRVLENKGRVLFFSAEMSPSQLSDRFAQNQSQRTIEDFRHLYNQDQTAIALQDQHQVMNGLNVNSFGDEFQKIDHFFNTHGHLTILGSKLGGMSDRQIIDAIAAGSQDSPYDLVVVDYLQIIQNASNSTTHNTPNFEKIKNVMENLTKAATEYQCPILILAQLNNPNRKQGSNTDPNLYDIAGSTAVVNDSSAVMALFKVPIDDSAQNNGNSQSLDLRLSVLKSRFGEVTESPFSVNRTKGSRFDFSA